MGVSTVSGKPRIPIYDYARVFVAYLVILGHVLPEGNFAIPYICAFHMPFFFLVSGMLHKKEDHDITKWVRTLLIPYILFNLLFLALVPFMLKMNIIDKVSSYSLDPDSNIFQLYQNIASQSIKRFFHGSTPPNGPTWFLLSLFYCKILLVIVNKHYLFALLALVAVILLPHHHVSYMFIGSTLMIFPFYYAGFKLKLLPLENVLSKIPFIAGCIFICISTLITIHNGRVSILKMTFGQIISPINIVVFYLNAFIASYGVLFICKLFNNKHIVTISANSLISILCLQMFFVYPFRTTELRNNFTACLFASLLIFVLCVLLHILIERYIPLLVGKRKKKFINLKNQFSNCT